MAQIDNGGFLWLDNKKHRTNRLAFLYITDEIPVRAGVTVLPPSLKT